MPSGGGWNFAGNRSRVDECRDHPYMRPSPFMHLQGQIPGVQLLKEGRLAHGMDINGAAADPRLSIHDLCNHQGQLVDIDCLEERIRGREKEIPLQEGLTVEEGAVQYRCWQPPSPHKSQGVILLSHHCCGGASKTSKAMPCK